MSTHGRIPVRSDSGDFPCRPFALSHGRIPVTALSGELPWRPLSAYLGRFPWRRVVLGRIPVSAVRVVSRANSRGVALGRTPVAAAVRADTIFRREAFRAVPIFRRGAVRGDPIFLLGCGSGNGNGNGGGGGEGGSRWRRPVPRLPLPPEDLLQRHREGHLLPQGQGTSCSGTEKAIFDLKDIAEEYGVLQAKVL